MKTRMKVLPALMLAGGLMMMPPAAEAEPITATIAEALMYFVGYDTAGLIASAIVSTAVSAAYSYVSASMTKANAGSAASQMAARTQMIRSPIAPRTKVYGRVQTSGPLLFVGVSDVGDGLNGAGGSTVSNGKNGFLHMIVALAAHEIDAVEEIYLNDQPLSVATMQAGSVRDGYYGGTDDHFEVISNITLPSGGTSFTFGVYSCATMLGLVEVGATAGAAPGGGEGGVDTFGRPLLPSGGTAGTDIPVTVSPDGTTGTFASASRSRNCVLHYLAKPVARSRVVVNVHLGTAGQTADSLLMSHMPGKWTANHKLSGIAYLYIRLQYDPKLFTTGIPNVKALIRGAKLHDPRAAGYPSDTPVYSNNYALCVLDYLKSPNGLNCADSDIDLPSIIASANSCDEPVTIASGVTQPRYTCDGAVTLDTDPEQNLRNLSTAGGGPVPLLVGGLFRIPVGVWSTPTARGLTASDLRGPVKMTPHAARRDLFNAVSGTFIEGKTTWQATSFPTVKNATYQASDGGEQIIRDITLPFTVDVIRAQRLAKILIERSRLATIVQWPGKPGCFAYSVGDIVPVTLSKFGWTNKNFRIIGWSMNENSSIDLTLQEDASTVYDWNMGAETPVDYSLNTGLPAANYVEPMGALTLYSDSSELVLAGDGTIISRLHVIWPAVKDASVAASGEIQVQYKKASETYWTPYDKISGTAVETWISPVVDTEIYYVRVRSVNGRGIPSDWVYGKHTIIGNTAAPPNVTGFNLAVRADGTRDFYWNTANQPATVLTGGGFRLKFRASGSGTAWQSMSLVAFGLISTGSFQTSNPQSGTWDFAIAAVSSNLKESTPSFITNAIVGREPVSYNASANLVPNSDFQLRNGIDYGENGIYRWVVQSYGTSPWNNTQARPCAVGINYSPWNPGKGGLWLEHSASVANYGGSTSPSVGNNLAANVYSDFFPVQANTAYEVSAYLNAHRCSCNLIIEWYTGAKAYIIGYAAQTSTPVGAGTSSDARGGWQAGINGMEFLWGSVVADPNAVYGRIVLQKFGTNSGANDSYAFWDRIMCCPLGPNTNRSTATPWIESAYDQLHGGSLQNLTVSSQQIANEAATTVVRSYNGGPITLTQNSFYGLSGINSIGYTAPVACTVTVNCTMHFYQQGTGYAGGGTIVSYGGQLSINTSGNGVNQTDGRQRAAFDWQTVDGTGTAVIQYRYDLSAGQAVGFYFDGGGGDTYTNLIVDYSTMVIEAVKK